MSNFLFDMSAKNENKMLIRIVYFSKKLKNKIERYSVAIRTKRKQTLFWLFCPIIYCVFTQKIPKKLIFPKIANIIRGGGGYTALFWHFCPIIYCVFTPKIPKKLIFPQIANVIQCTLLTFLSKMIFSTNEHVYRALFWLFCPIIQCVFTPKIVKKSNFP